MIEQILVREGDVIAIGAVLARIDPDAKAAAATPPREAAKVPQRRACAAGPCEVGSAADPRLHRSALVRPRRGDRRARDAGRAPHGGGRRHRSARGQGHRKRRARHEGRRRAPPGPAAPMAAQPDRPPPRRPPPPRRRRSARPAPREAQSVRLPARPRRPRGPDVADAPHHRRAHGATRSARAPTSGPSPRSTCRPSCACAASTRRPSRRARASR